MSSLSLIARPGQSRGSKPLQSLQDWLMDNHYSQHAWEQIVAHTAICGTPTGSPYLDREDEECATAVFIEAMGGVPYDDESAWGSLTPEFSVGQVIAELLRDGPTLRAIPPELDDDDDQVGRLIEAWEANHEAQMAALEADRLPLDDAPYDPTAEDEADYLAWLADMESRRDCAALALPPISGGAPAGPSPQDVAEAHAYCAAMDAIEEGRRVEGLRNPLYGYE